MEGGRDYITFFYALEKVIWGNKVETNKYLATLSILFVALVGAWHTDVSILKTLLGWDSPISVSHALTLMAYLWIMNIMESVIACKDLATAVLRSLLILPALGIAYFLGHVLGTVAVVIVFIILLVILGYMLIGLFTGSHDTNNSSRARI